MSGTKTETGADARLTPADLTPGWRSAYHAEGLQGVVYRDRNGWHFWNRNNDAWGTVHNRAAAVVALGQVQGLTRPPSSNKGANDNG